MFASMLVEKRIWNVK